MNHRDTEAQSRIKTAENAQNAESKNMRNEQEQQGGQHGVTGPLQDGPLGETVPTLQDGGPLGETVPASVEMPRKQKVLLYVMGFMEELKEKGLITCAYTVTEKGHKDLLALKAEGFVPTDEEFGDAFATLALEDLGEDANHGATEAQSHLSPALSPKGGEGVGTAQGDQR